MPETASIPSVRSTDATSNKGQWACPGYGGPCGSLYVPKRNADPKTDLCTFCAGEADRVKRERSWKTPRWE